MKKQKAQLEQNIQMALSKNDINLEDAIDIREIKNIKLANQMLKVRRKAKQDQEQQAAQQKAQQQAQINMQSQQAAAQAAMQKSFKWKLKLKWRLSKLKLNSLLKR